MDDSLLQRYSRHILLDDIGVEGQERLRAAKIVIAGAGGLGCPAALYLAAAGVGEIVIYDDDEVDLTNLQRQILHCTDDIGKAKVASAARKLAAINANCRVSPVRARLDAANAAAEVADCAAVLDCSDNYPSRHAINRACVSAKTPLVFGAAAGFDGQMAVFDSRDSESPCYHCLFDENGDAPETPCALFGVFAPLVGIVGCMQAAAAIKIIAAPHLAATGKLLLIEARKMEIREVRVPRDSQCTVCG